MGKNKEINLGRGWHRSKERVAGLNPYGGYLANKKWYLNEVIIKRVHIYRHKAIPNIILGNG